MQAIDIMNCYAVQACAQWSKTACTAAGWLNPAKKCIARQEIKQCVYTAIDARSKDIF
jgi:hypothetical protein